ncbi:methyltransferase-like protein 25B [Battus philenor]|uniref:methyltransferase-like protein 25B n=1 Tax=Battus philenor TaxID=42288 RepID=UPI0035CE99ED
MTLPPCFDSYDDYFEESTAFFEEYQHLYNFANTDILIKGVLDDICIDDLINIDVYKDDFNIRNEIDDPFIDEFFNKLDRLHADYSFVEEQDVHTINVPLGPKKKHEIVYLATEIAKLCEKIGCDTVVDFGSGLGYLDQVIFDITNYNVLGLEANENHYVGAKKRQNKYHIDSTDSVKFIRHRITDQSNLNLEGFLNDKFPNYKNFCITGLHACADLTVDAMNIFLKMPDAKSMILMPCCYHKMRLENLSDEKFANFPLSNCLKEKFLKKSGFEYMRVPFLRLAAQPHLTSQCNIKNLVFNLLARAVLQVYAHKHHYKIKRKKRKAVKVRTIENNFKSYAYDACTEGFLFINNDPTELNECIDFKHKNKSSGHKVIFEELKLIWREIPPLTFKKAAIFILLQNYLQPVIENFILLDRIVYFREKGLLNISCKKIVNDKISPRCLALFAHK